MATTNITTTFIDGVPALGENFAVKGTLKLKIEYTRNAKSVTIHSATPTVNIDPGTGTYNMIALAYHKAKPTENKSEQESAYSSSSVVTCMINDGSYASGKDYSCAAMQLNSEIDLSPEATSTTVYFYMTNDIGSGNASKKQTIWNNACYCPIPVRLEVGQGWYPVKWDNPNVTCSGVNGTNVMQDEITISWNKPEVKVNSIECQVWVYGCNQYDTIIANAIYKVSQITGTSVTIRRAALENKLGYACRYNKEGELISWSVGRVVVNIYPKHGSLLTSASSFQMNGAPWAGLDLPAEDAVWVLGGDEVSIVATAPDSADKCPNPSGGSPFRKAYLCFGENGLGQKYELVNKTYENSVTTWSYNSKAIYEANSLYWLAHAGEEIKVYTQLVDNYGTEGAICDSGHTYRFGSNLTIGNVSEPTSDNGGKISIAGIKIDEKPISSASISWRLFCNNELLTEDESNYTSANGLTIDAFRLAQQEGLYDHAQDQSFTFKIELSLGSLSYEREFDPLETKKVEIISATYYKADGDSTLKYPYGQYSPVARNSVTLKWETAIPNGVEHDVSIQWQGGTTALDAKSDLSKTSEMSFTKEDIKSSQSATLIVGIKRPGQEEAIYTISKQFNWPHGLAIGNQNAIPVVVWFAEPKLSLEAKMNNDSQDFLTPDLAVAVEGTDVPVGYKLTLSWDGKDWAYGSINYGQNFALVGYRAMFDNYDDGTDYDIEWELDGNTRFEVNKDFQQGTESSPIYTWPAIDCTAHFSVKDVNDKLDFDKFASEGRWELTENNQKPDEDGSKEFVQLDYNNTYCLFHYLRPALVCYTGFTLTEEGESKVWTPNAGSEILDVTLPEAVGYFYFNTECLPTQPGDPLLGRYYYTKQGGNS